MKLLTQQIQTQNTLNKQNEYHFTVQQSKTLEISSNFQNGNIRLVRQINHQQYVLEAVKDHDSINYKKSWFYFKMASNSQQKVKITIQNVNIFESVNDNKSDCAITYRKGNEKEWKTMKVILVQQENYRAYPQLSLCFSYKFSGDEFAYFCLSVPFTYSDNQAYFAKLKCNISNKISYKDQVLALTPQKREVKLITITQYSSKDNFNDKIKKPVVLITARVHPGEVSSSFCMLGIVQTLLDPKSLQSYLLRRLFQWKIVPMINPDGVVSGNYRTDPRGDNLNRNYLEPDINLHPVIYKIVQIMKQLSNNGRKIQYYFDLHSHSCMKDAFIYGNAFDNVLHQAHSQLFCKVLEENTQFFKNSLSQFGEKHMKFKDKAQKRTKQGCGRVVAWKIGKVIASYTLQSTVLPYYYQKQLKNEMKPVKNEKFNYQPLDYEKVLNLQEQRFRGNQYHQLTRANRKLGEAVLISILDINRKNPYTRLSQNFIQKQFLLFRKKLLRNEQRFKLKDIYLSGKLKMRNDQIMAQYQKQICLNWQQFNFIYELARYKDWPQEVELSYSNKKEKALSKREIKQTKTQHSSVKEYLKNQNEYNKTQSSLEEDMLANVKIKLKAQEKKAQYSNKLKSMNNQEKQTSATNHREFPIKQKVLSFADCFLQLQEKICLKKINRYEIGSIPDYLIKSQNAIELQDQFRKNTQSIKRYKDCVSIKKNEGNKLKQSLSKVKRENIGNNYLCFLQRRKRTRTQSKNQIDLIPNLSLPRSYSSLNNKLLPLNNELAKKDKICQDLRQVDVQSIPKRLKLGLNLPYLERSHRISSKKKQLFSEKKS